MPDTTFLQQVELDAAAAVDGITYISTFGGWHPTNAARVYGEQLGLDDAAIAGLEKAEREGNLLSNAVASSVNDLGDKINQKAAQVTDLGSFLDNYGLPLLVIFGGLYAYSVLRAA